MRSLWRVWPQTDLTKDLTLTLNSQVKINERMTRAEDINININAVGKGEAELLLPSSEWHEVLVSAFLAAEDMGKYRGNGRKDRLYSSFLLCQNEI
jgi:hypothetical protein